MKKFVLFLILSMLLMSLFSVCAFAQAEGGEGSENSIVDKVTDKVTQYAGDIKAQFSTLNDGVKNLLGGVAEYLPLAIGALLLIECFFGYKLLGLQMFLAGAYIGMASGLLGFTHLVAKVNVPGDYVKWIVAGLCAIVFALLFMALKKVGLVVFIGVFSFMKLVDYTDNIIVQAALAAVIVLLSICFFKYIFIHATSIFGAVKGVQMIFAVPLVANVVDLSKYLVNTPKAPAYYVGLLVAFFGVFVQFKLAKKKRF